MNEAMQKVEDNGPADAAVQAVLEEQDTPGLRCAQVRCALALGLAPIVAQARDALHELLRAAGVNVAEELTVEDFVNGIVSRELADLRAKALWPFAPGTRVSVRAGDNWWESRTKSEARALPNGDVLVDVEHKIGGTRVQDLRPL